MPNPPDILFVPTQCIQANLAPQSSAEVWACVEKIKNYISSISNGNYVAVRFHPNAIGGQNIRLVFRRNPTSNNLITVWPKWDTLAINAIASGPRSGNRINGEKQISPTNFFLKFLTISGAIDEVFMR